MTAQRRADPGDPGEHWAGTRPPEQIYRTVRQQDPSINPSTVYRTLGWLADAGLIDARHLAAGRNAGRRQEQFDPLIAR